ncbi:hypothetical protein ACFXJ8_10160 [Nonomuraea sp. NPDC059194]
MTQYEKAMRPEDITRLFVERSNVRRQPDGSWLRALDQPEFVPPARGA